MRRVAILQARMTSTRLPGKVLKSILGRPMLAFELERMKHCQFLDDLVVATTGNTADDPLISLCEQMDIAIYRGSEHDVLGRFYAAAQQAQADVVIRVTGDCPLIDAEVVDAVIAQYQAAQAAGEPVDYVSNTLERTFPRGLDVEVFSFSALEKAHQQGNDPVEREHVTPYIYRHPELFGIRQYKQPNDVSHLRWTVDTAEDFALIEHIMRALYPNKPNFTQQDVLDLLAIHPDWAEMNAHIEQIKVQ